MLWGARFEVARVGARRWLADSEVFNWDDLDSHGFALGLRAGLPQTRFP